MSVNLASDLVVGSVIPMRVAGVVAHWTVTAVEPKGRRVKVFVTPDAPDGKPYVTFGLREVVPVLP